MEIRIDQERCKGCDLCLKLCPKKVFEETQSIGTEGFKLRAPVKIEDCSECGFCQYFCPEGAISLGGEIPLIDEFWQKMKEIKERAARENMPRGGWKVVKTHYPGTHNISGNTAFVWGALDAGCEADFPYPITPASSQGYEAEKQMRRLNEISAQELKKRKRIFYQLEKEDVCMIALCAASLAGLKAMTATSGPGLSRMPENLSLALTDELPLVIADVQRTGPSTGRPTGTGAGEVREARWGSHGGTEHIVLYPSSVQECYDLAIKAFNLAEEYRVPVIVLMEASTANLEERVEIPEEIRVFDRVYKPGFPPFGPTEDGSAPSMPRFGEGEILKVTGLTHNRFGVPCANEPRVHEEMVEHQRRKITSKTEELTDVEEFLLDDAEIMLVVYGHTARAARWAVEKAREKGIKVGLLKLRTLYPFPEKKIEEWSKKVYRVDVPEMNQGQLFYVVRESSASPVVSLPQPDGESIDPRRILKYLEESRGKYYREAPPVIVPTIYSPPEWQREKIEISEITFSPQTPFCPGCGLGILRNCLLQATKDLGWDPQKIVLVSGIGCAARLPNHLPFDSANLTHGYAVPFAVWLKWVAPELKVIATSGEGDEFNIGLGETLFGAKRNIPVTVICFNNFVFGMTGGQVSATTPLGAKTSTTPAGNIEKPFDLVKMMLTSGAKFASRVPVSKPLVLTKILKEALSFDRGLSFVEVISPCLDQYTKRNMPASPSELMKKLDKAYIFKNQKLYKKDLKEGFMTAFPFREDLGVEIEDEELLQIICGKFSSLREYINLVRIGRKK